MICATHSHRLARLAAATGIALLGVCPAAGGIGLENAVPPEPAYVVSVPSVPAGWAALKASPLALIAEKLVSHPDVVPRMDEVKRQLADVEAGLGFKLDGDTLSSVVGSVDFYAMPGERAADLTVGVILKITDKEKAEKLINLFERAAQRASGGDSRTTGAESRSAVRTVTVDGVEIKEFSGDGDGGAFYVMKGDVLIISNEGSEVHGVVRRLEGQGEGYEDTEDFKKLDGRLGSDGEAFVYTDPARSSGLTLGDRQSELEGFMNSIYPFSSAGHAVSIKPDRVVWRTFSSLREGEDPMGIKQLIAAHPVGSPFGAAAYAPDKPLIYFGTRLVDLQMLLDTLKNATANLNPVAAGQIDAALDSTDQQLGFSIRNDLIPAIGNEFQVVVGSAAMENNFPKVDAAIQFSVKDREKVGKVLDALERKAGTTRGAMGTSPKEKMFASKEIDGATIKYLQLPLPGDYAPAFGLHGDYFILASTPDAITSMVATQKEGKGLANGEVLKADGETFTTTAHSLTVVDVGGVVDVIKSFLAGRSRDDSSAKFVEAFQSLGLLRENSTATNEGFESRSVLTFR